ncbi:MAG: hypothetical protein MUF24_04245 [Chitinophagaceae bacterium]|jgi:hypothetical protein|nr:hypothetical protein [Chitinophagaceae bacterium]
MNIVKAFITWIAIAGMMLINYLANALPLNGYTTGALSSFYPNLFVPDGLTFSIWGIIYLWLLVAAAFLTGLLLKTQSESRYQWVHARLPLLWLTCLFNALWIVAWHYLQTGLSVLVMLSLLATLLLIFRQIHAGRNSFSKKENLLANVPFVIYFGWISVATVANITALLVFWGWQGWGISPGTWALVMMVVATAAGALLSFGFQRPAYTFVICWALWGIYRARVAQNEFFLSEAALFLLAFSLLVGAYTLVKSNGTAVA